MAAKLTSKNAAASGKIVQIRIQEWKMTELLFRAYRFVRRHRPKSKMTVNFTSENVTISIQISNKCTPWNRLEIGTHCQWGKFRQWTKNPCEIKKKNTPNLKIVTSYDDSHFEIWIFYYFLWENTFNSRCECPRSSQHGSNEIWGCDDFNW